MDGDTLVLGDTRIRLFGIDAPEMLQNCTDTHGTEWGCGAWSKAVLERLTQGGVSCDARDIDRYGRTVAVCVGADGDDINAAMVAAGAAYAYEKYARDYIETEATARAGGYGIWHAGGQDPAEFRAEKRASRRSSQSPQVAPAGCLIKGNISASGKLYHLPGGRWYTGTRITASTGERWFCSEREAKTAGWRRAKG